MSADTLQRDAIAAYRQPVHEVLAALRTDGHRGLTRQEAKARLAHYSRNELTADKPVPAWKQFLTQFQDLIVILLLIATGPWRG